MFRMGPGILLYNKCNEEMEKESAMVKFSHVITVQVTKSRNWP